MICLADEASQLLHFFYKFHIVLTESFTYAVCMGKLKAAALCAWGFGTTGIYTLAAFVPIILLAPFSRTGRAPYTIGKIWSQLIFWTNRVKLETAGVENIHTNRSYVFMANHVSHLDPPAVALAIPNTLRFIGKLSLSRIPVFGPAARRAGVIFIDRGDAEKSHAELNRSITVLKEGVSTLFFAEGTRSLGGQLLPFKKGGVMLALQTGLPIVPVTVTGSYALFPKKQLFIRPGTVHVEIGTPIEVAGFTPADRDRLLMRIRAVIQENLDRYNQAQSCKPEALAQRARSASTPHLS